MTKAVRIVLLLVLCAAVLAGCKQPEPPPPPPPPPVEKPPPPSTFPVTEVSGTLAGWSEGEAFVTLTGGYSSTSTDDPDVEGLELVPPLYPGSVAADGTFLVELSAPDPATLIPLGCNASDPNIAGLTFAVASSVVTPTTTDEVFGLYSKGDPAASGKQNIYLYVAEAFQAIATCTQTMETNLSNIDLTLAPGWNQVTLEYTDVGNAILTTEPVSDTQNWSELPGF